MALRADDVDLGRDRDLVERFQGGDPQAFDDLYRRYFDRLRRFCLRHTSDVHEAEEVAQEAFVRAFDSMHTLTAERRFYPWLTVIAKRISIDRHRKHRRVEPTAQPDLGSVEADVEHLFAEVDAGHVRAAMARVGPRHREVLLLREARAMSYADIAEHLDVPVTTVEALLHRARKALRREYAAVTGDGDGTRGNGAWGLPLLGLAAAKAVRLRGRLAERWADAAAVLAPAAAGVVTAAVVLAPGAGPAQQSGEPGGGPGRATIEVVDQAPADPGQPVQVTQRPVAAAGSRPAASTSGSRPPADEAADPHRVGPIDVFRGPDGAARARNEAADMPVSADAGPATAGVDPDAILDSVTDAVPLISRTPLTLSPTAGGTP